MNLEKVKNQKSLAILICYFGKLPWFFDYFVHSCKYNNTLDFYVVTDDTAYSGNLPDNVYLINKTIEEVSAIAEDRLGFPVNIKSAYKLCDFKPAYGLIFSDILAKYDFWGHGDIDVIFGDIRSFITDEVLDANDLICVRHDFLTGYFLLFRNNEKMNRFFTLSKDYKKVLSDDKHYCFDETNFKWDEFAEGQPWYEIDSEIESMMHLVRKKEQENYIRTYFDFLVIEGLPGRLKWIAGKLFYKNQYEVLLYHLIYFKRRYTPKKTARELPEAFTISPTRIYHKKP